MKHSSRQIRRQKLIFQQTILLGNVFGPVKNSGIDVIVFYHYVDYENKTKGSEIFNVTIDLCNTILSIFESTLSHLQMRAI